jgi:mitofusin
LNAVTKEKAYIFIVVNRFDLITKKERNRKEILEQIREISVSSFGIIFGIDP